jgi:hypothetical protein
VPSKASELAIVEGMDRDNFSGISRECAEAVRFADGVHGLYVMHSDAIDPYLVTVQHKAAAALFIVCRKHLVLGALSLMRLYSAQMYRESRAAVEAAGVARLIVNDMAAFRIFSSDDGTPAAAKKARETFKTKILFPQTVPILKTLYDHYDLASRLSHTSGLTFLRHIVTNPEPGSALFTYQDIHKDHLKRDVVQHFLWLCMAHLSILISADDTFGSVKARLEEFRRGRAALFSRLAQFRAQQPNV